MKRYKKLLIALAAVASIYMVRATGLDQGLIDEVFNSAVEAIVGEESAMPEADVGSAVEMPAPAAEQMDAEALDSQR